MALVSQVRAGLWVRNGFSMKAQHLHYRDYSLRETAWEQDLFFLQTAFVAADPSIVVATLVDRFGLRDLLFKHTIPASAPFEPEQGLSLLDELLGVVIALVSDPTWAAPLAPADTLRRELLHYLALAPTTYSDLLSHVSDRFADDPTIDRILGQIAQFKPPSGSNDQGMYSLLPDLMAEVDINFQHYTRNQRADAEALVKEWEKKRTRSARAIEDIVIVPRPLPVDAARSGPFVALPRAFVSHGMQALIVAALLAGRGVSTEVADGEASIGRTVSSDAVVERALQLCLLAQVEQPEALAAACLEPWSFGSEQHFTLAQLLVDIEEDEQSKGPRAKARYLVDALIERRGVEVASLRKAAPSTEEDKSGVTAEQYLEAKRAAAKARQAAIMQKFQQAQSAFLQKMEGEAGLDDLDGDDEDAAMVESGAEPTMSTSTAPQIDFGSCIVCQEALESTAPFGLLGCIQSSRFIRLTPDDEGEARHTAAPFIEEVLNLPASLDRDMSSSRPYGTASVKANAGDQRTAEDGLAQGFPLSTKAGLHASSCGHMMHLPCFEQYCASAIQRHAAQPDRQHPEELERREFVCPLCKSLGNVILPVESDSTAFVPYSGGFDERPLSEWGQRLADPLELGSLTRLGPDFERRVDKLSTVASVNDPPAAFRPWLAQSSLLTLLPEHFEEAEGRMAGGLLQVVGSLAEEGRLNKPTLTDHLLSYTVATLEVASRGTADPVWEVSQANVHLLQSMTQVLRDLAELMTQSNDSMRVAATSLRQRLGGEFSEGSKYDRLTSLQVNPLSQVIEAAVCAPSAFYHVVSVAFYTHLVSSLVAYYRLAYRVQAFPHAEKESSDDADEASTLAQLRHVFAGNVSPEWSNDDELPVFFPRLFAEESSAVAAGLGKHLHAQMTVFLRRVAIIARVLLGAPSEEAIDAFLDDERTEYARLLELLRIPHPSHVLDGLLSRPTSLGGDVDTLGRHVLTLRSRLWAFTRPADELLQRQEITISTFFSSHWPELFPEHPAPYELLGLPKHLDSLLAEILERECQQCGQVPSNPALCLFCGELVCAQMFCCMTDYEDEARGECNEHMWG